MKFSTIYKYVFFIGIVLSQQLSAQPQNNLHNNFSNIIMKQDNLTNLLGNITPPKFIYSSINQEITRLNEFDKVQSGTNSSGYQPLYYTRQILLTSVKFEPEPSVTLKLSTDDANENKKDESFFSSDIFYFIGAAALATTFYFIWDSNDKTVSKRTFGTPPKP